MRESMRAICNENWKAFRCDHCDKHFCVERSYDLELTVTCPYCRIQYEIKTTLEFSECFNEVE